MKAILISIKPKYVAKILNGEKTIEIRKTCPEIFKHLKSYEGASLDVYIYCTKEEELFYNVLTQKWYVAKNRKNVKRLSNGVVKAKFTLNKVEEVGYSPRTLFDSDSYYLGNPTRNMLSSLLGNPLYEKSCLSKYELHRYLKGKKGYAWHISDLEIFDKPKELSEFKPYVKGKCMTSKCHFQKNYMCEVECNLGLTRSPQSWQFIEVRGEQK